MIHSLQRYKFWIIFTISIIGIKYSTAQCSGSPLYILPNNSTGNLAFPESNLDPLTGAWTRDNHYPLSVTCTWVLKAPPLHVIYLKILSFNTEEQFDFITFYPSLSRNEELFKFSGNLKNFWDIFSPDNTLVIDFVSDDYTNYDGFHFAYMYLPKACVTGGVSITEAQLIALPPWNLQGALPGPQRPGYEAPSIGVEIPLLQEINDPSPRWLNVSPYPQGLNCTWQIMVPQKHLLQIDVLQYDTDLDDVLQIWKIGESGPKPLFKFWGTEIPSNQIKSSDPVLLNFVSGVDERGANSGFLLNVTYVSRGCSPARLEQTSPSAYIGYPSHNFRNNNWEIENPISYGPDYCEWVLRAPKGYVFNISILHLDTRDEDFVELTENGTSLLKIGGKLEGPFDAISKTNLVQIKFSSTSESQNTGFLILYSWFLKDCNFELTAEEGEVRSPYYPDVYGLPLECSWIIKTEPGVVVHFLVSRLRLDEGDFLQVTDGSKTVLFSSSSVNPDLMEFFPTKSSVTVNFLSNNQNNKGYFLLKYNYFHPGNCNFSITTCGWTSKDPIGIWEFKEEEHIVTLDEKSKIGFHLPRGYRSQFMSPVIYPTEGVKDMCFRFQYLLAGQDAYKLSVSLTEFSDEQIAALLSNELFLDSMKHEHLRKSLLDFHGTQGELFLEASVNVTVSKPIQISVSYERGYGPHYKVSLREMRLTNQRCQSQGSDGLSSLSCQFKATFCAWRNTHKDHKNWEIRDNGVTSPVDENIEASIQRKLMNTQHADLISPVVNLSTYKQKENASEVCLNLSYKIYSQFSELKLLIVSDDLESPSGSVFGGQSTKEEEIWGQGRISSPKVLQAQIPLALDILPSKFHVVLRAMSSHSSAPVIIKRNEASEFGVSVYGIDLQRGTCSQANVCNFQSGFCSWRIVSTGNSVWHIKEIENESFAAFSSNGRKGDLSQMISETISAKSPKTLSFRYLIKDTKQCIKIGTMFLNGEQISPNKNTPLNVIWEQCKGKGDHWLNECVDLPLYEGFFKITIATSTGIETSNVWLDDLSILPGHCNVQSSEENTELKRTTWNCLPEVSLCGMTQSPLGTWDWSYYHKTSHNDLRNRLNLQPNMDIMPKNSPYLNSEYDDFRQYTAIVNPTQEASFYANHIGGENNNFNNNVPHSMNERKGKPLNQAEGENFGKQTQNRIVCTDGSVLDPSWACDGIPDCEDGSDEKECDCGPDGCGEFEDTDESKDKCKEGFFLCPSGHRCPKEECSKETRKCLPQSFLCDGEVHCNNGEDEHVCGLKDEGWQSDDPKTIKKRQATLMYEKFGYGSNVINRGLFECSGGLLIPSSFLCDGRKDCPLDGLDEVGCLQCGADEFLCPKTGFCLPKTVVCDGELSIETCTDEFACHQCEPGYFACDICLPSMKVCDGVWDCSMGEDEIRCRDLSSQNLLSDSAFQSGIELSEPTMTDLGHFPKCHEHQFSCYNGKCMPLSSVCDRQIDCLTGDDEYNCDDDNTEEEYYIRAKPSVAENLDPWSNFPSYLTTPILHQEVKQIGVLSFNYRLDSWIGSSNVTLSIELLNPNDTSVSLTPSSLWRQTGNKGKLWLSDYVIIPQMPEIKEYKIGFLLSGLTLPHRSQQIHLSKISFKNTNEENLQDLAKQWTVCEFTNNWCGWTQTYTEGGYSWVHAMTSPHARRTGPITGHPDDEYSGFIFADSLSGEEGESADLLSPLLQLEEKGGQILCFRFAMFLYGANIGRLSLHVMQVTSTGHSFTKELFSTDGGKGLSWIPVGITIDKSTLKEPFSPFVIVFRAVKGNGPEADISLDHFSITNGSCDSDTNINENFILLPLTSSPFLHIKSLKHGLSHTPYIQKTNLEETSKDMLKNPINDNSMTLFDLCSLFKTCVDCVLSSIEECTWCAKTHSCSSSLSSEARACSTQFAVHSNTTDEIKSGPMWCPRLAPDQPKEIVVPSESLISLSFPVTNIQSSHTKSSWLCIFTMENELSSNFDDVKSSNEGNDVDGLKNKENKVSDDEELWKRLKKYALDRKFGKRVIKVSGTFQGTVYRSSLTDASVPEVGVGAIKCSDEETLMEIPSGIQKATMKVQLQTPDGGLLDNPDNVYVKVYRCTEMATDCIACVNLNSSFPCGWCTFTHTCTSHTQCVNGLWHSHSDEASQVCSVQEELNFIKNLLESDENQEDLGTFDDEDLIGEELSFLFPTKKKLGTKKNAKNLMKKSLGEKRNRFKDVDEEMIEEENEENKIKESENNKGKVKTLNKKKDKHKIEKGSGKSGGKGSLKIGKKTRGKGFLKIPIQNGVFIARDVWRLHTGRQYYVPVTKKTLINLGFVRHVNYGRLSEEKSRTLLMDGAWKKAAGFFIDLYEKAGQDPMTSIITTNKDTFEKILGQLLPETS